MTPVKYKSCVFFVPNLIIGIYKKSKQKIWLSDEPKNDDVSSVFYYFTKN